MWIKVDPMCNFDPVRCGLSSLSLAGSMFAMAAGETDAKAALMEAPEAQAGSNAERTDPASAQQGPQGVANELSPTGPPAVGSDLDKNKVADYMDSNAKGTDAYGQQCARVCHAALYAGGPRSMEDRPSPAKENGPWLVKHGAKVVVQGDTAKQPEGYTPQKGDVAVFQGGQNRNKSGHMQIYDGRQWVSDTHQTTFSPRRNYEGGVTVYRFP
jgi:hypothetical protein